MFMKQILKTFVYEVPGKLTAFERNPETAALSSSSSEDATTAVKSHVN
jgi:hypothetical protein